MTERTLQLCGKDVTILYCAATETGYERLSGKSIEVFLPTFGPDPDDAEKTIMTAPPTATTEDYLQLSIAAIVAASEYRKQEVPISADDLLYQAPKQEVTDLITAVIELRNEWYGLSKVIPPGEQPKEEEEEDKPKN